MKLKAMLESNFIFYHSDTMKELTVDKVIERVYNEDSEEYKTLCEDYTNTIGFERKENKEKFDKEMLQIMINEMKHFELETIEKYNETIKNCFLNNCNAYINVSGTIVNLKHFCAVKIKAFKTTLSKQ